MPGPAIYYPAIHGEGAIEIPALHLLSPQFSEGFNNFSPIIVLGGTLDFVKEEGERESEAARIEREIFNSLERGNVVCLTFHVDDLVRRVLDRIGIYYSFSKKLEVELVVKRSEFMPFYKEFGTVNCRFTSGDFDDVICENSDGFTVGFAKKVGKGVLIVLPCRVLYKKFANYDFLDRFLTVLFEVLDRYGPKIQYKPPSWVGSFRFLEEALVISEMKKFEKELNKRANSLKKYLKLKEILWFRDDELVRSTMDFLDKLGIKTKRDEIYEEDFWIMEKNKESVIVEVKSLDKNLKRLHISQLDEHRCAREKPDDFPALLIVNSFNKAKSLKGKDKAISANEIKKAVRTDVLILRTLDLCNAYYLMEEKKLDPRSLLKLIKEEKGWLNITSSGIKVRR